jgi:hypothetical protein
MYLEEVYLSSGVVPSPYEDPELYAGILLGNVFSPGIVTLSGHDRKLDWDVQKAKGQDGASSKLTGVPIGTFRASFYLTDQLDREDWDEFQRLIEGTIKGPTPVALPVYHPDLARNGFTDVVLGPGGISGMTHDSVGGSTVVVEFIEHRPPKPKPAATASSRATGSSATSNQGQAASDYDPNAARRAELAALTDQAREP